jgi:hypothetical protein
MAEILLVNPRRRRRKMSAKQARYFGKRRRRRSTRVSARRRRRNPSHLLSMNPRRRRRRRSVARVIGRRRRNPGLGGFSLRNIQNQIVPTLRGGFTGALGGLGLDVLMGFVGPKLPAALQTGFAKDAVKVVGAVLVGILGGTVLRGKGRELAVGAVTISMHDLLKAQVQSMLPTLPLGCDYGYMDPGSTIDAYLEDESGAASGYGAYVDGLGDAIDTDQSDLDV